MQGGCPDKAISRNGAIYGVARQSVLFSEYCRLLPCRIKNGNAAISGQPDACLCILADALNTFSGKTQSIRTIFIRLDDTYRIPRPVKQHQSAARTGPDLPTAVLIQCPDPEMGQRQGIAVGRHIVADFAGNRIKPVQSPGSAKPENTPAVLIYQANIRMGQGLACTGELCQRRYRHRAQRHLDNPLYSRRHPQLIAVQIEGPYIITAHLLPQIKRLNHARRCILMRREMQSGQSLTGTYPESVIALGGEGPDNITVQSAFLQRRRPVCMKR